MATTPAKTGAARGAAKGATRGAAKAASASAAAAAGEAGAMPDMAPGASGEKASVEIKLKDLVERVTAATGSKKPQVRAVVDAMLKEMGDALMAAQVLNLPGFGKMRVVRPAETPNGTMTLKLRRGVAGGAKADAGAEPLAEPGEDS